VPRLIGIEHARAHVHGLGRYTQRLGQLLQHMRRWLAQTALDLAEVRVGDTGLLGQLPQGELSASSPLADEVAERPHCSTNIQLVHELSCLPTASMCKPEN
jgi:hypothetical protein